MAIDEAERNMVDDWARLKKPEAELGIKSWRSIFNFTQRTHLLMLIPALILSVISGLIQPIMSLLLGRLMDSFAEVDSGIIDGDEFMDRVLKTIHAMIGLAVLNWLFKGAFFGSWVIYGEMQARSVRVSLFRSLIERNLEWFDARDSGTSSLLTTLQRQIRDLQIGTSQPLGFATMSIVEGIASLSVAFASSWRIALIVLAAFPLIVLILALFQRGIQEVIKNHEIKLSSATKVAYHAIANIMLIKVFDTEYQEVIAYVKEIADAALLRRKQAHVHAQTASFMVLAMTAIVVGAFSYGSQLAHENLATPGKVLTAFWSSLTASKTFDDIISHLTVLQNGRAAAISLQTIVDHGEKREKLPQAFNRLIPASIEGDIEVHNVSFSYSSRPDHLILKQCNLFFPASETTFIVGQSGSGKSTLGSLLVRFYTPQIGQVLLDGINVEDLDAKWLRNNVTLVQQQGVLFNETLLRNITLGHQNYEKFTQSQLYEFVALAVLEDMLAQLPDGLDTMLGFDGSTISGGQRQRVAIARARVRDTRVLILDESTSALDKVTKEKVMANLRAWRKGRTTIIITHDLSQIEDEDFVYVMKDGEIIAEGFHHVLRSKVKTELPAGTAVSEDQWKEMRKPQNNRYPVSRSSSETHARLPMQLSLHQSSPVGMSPDPHSQEYCRLLDGRPEAGNRKSNVLRANQVTTEEPLLGILIGPGTSPAVQSRGQYQTQHLRAVSAKTIGSVIDKNKIHSPSGLHPSSPLFPIAGGNRPMSLHAAMVMSTIYRQSEQICLPTSDDYIPMKTNTMDLDDSREPHIPLLKKFSTPSEAPPSVLQILKTVWPQLTSKYRIYLSIGFGSVLVHALCPSVASYIHVYLLQNIYASDDWKADSKKWSLLSMLVGLIDFVATYLLLLSFEVVAQVWVDSLRKEALTRVLSQPMEWFDEKQNSSSSICASLDRNAEEMRNLLARFAAFSLVIVIMVTITVIWCMIVCWKLTLVGTALLPLVYLSAKSFELVSLKWESHTNTAAEAVGNVFAETFTGIGTVRALTLEAHFHKKFTTVTRKAFSLGLRRAVFGGVCFGASDSALLFVTIGVLGYGAKLTHSSEFSIKDIFTVFTLLINATTGTASTISFIPQISSSIDTATRLLRLVSLKQQLTNQRGKVHIRNLSIRERSTPVKLEDLTFHYPTRPAISALANVHLTIPQNKYTVLVGPSGSGKSTIASLLLGLYMADDQSSAQAQLTLFGRDIRELSLSSLRSVIAYVPQQTVIFPMSVRDNILYGDMEVFLRTEANMIAAAEAASIHEFIMTLPSGYDTIIGEGGLEVSGGEAQRIAIARALVRKPSILILDEPTSALDIGTALKIRQTIFGLIDREGQNHSRKNTPAKSMIVLIITHAREMMELADYVAVLESGRLVESGGFNELIQRKGKLWEMLHDENTNRVDGWMLSSEQQPL